MRVVTLLPAATEMVAALGGAGHLVGISHECDYPPSIRRLPRVTTTPIDPELPGAAIDAEVRRLRESGRPVIGIDLEQLLTLRPDLIVTQGLCEVCAVSDGQVQGAAAAMSGATLLSLTARNVEGVWHDIHAVGDAMDLADEAEELVLGLRTRLQRLRRQRPSRPIRVLCIEWLEPLYLAGHWVPELVEAAGGQDVGAEPGSPSRRHEWRELHQLEPDRILVMLCGFGVERARSELNRLEETEALDLMSRVPTHILDGNSYTSRPGPRIVDGASQIHSAIVGAADRGLEQWIPPLRYSRS